MRGVWISTFSRDAMQVLCLSLAGRWWRAKCETGQLKKDQKLLLLSVFLSECFHPFPKKAHSCEVPPFDVLHHILNHVNKQFPLYFHKARLWTSMYQRSPLTIIKKLTNFHLLHNSKWLLPTAPSFGSAHLQIGSFRFTWHMVSTTVKHQTLHPHHDDCQVLSVCRIVTTNGWQIWCTRTWMKLEYQLS